MGTRIGYAVGAFDLFHVGHLNLLRHAKQHCDVLVAGVVSDEMLRQVKGIEPVIPTAERADIRLDAEDWALLDAAFPPPERKLPLAVI